MGHIGTGKDYLSSLGLVWFRAVSIVMNCGRCVNSYGPSRLPRILTRCGHSLCTACIHSLLHKGSIVCPDCGLATICLQVADLPMNKALISAKEVLCVAHNRTIEAFCLDDKDTLCVDCLLASHKGHEVVGLAVGAKAVKQGLETAIGKGEALKTKLTLMREEMDKISAEKEREFSAVIEDVEDVFGAIAAAAKARESQLKEKFKQMLEVCLEANKQRKTAIIRQLAAINLLIREGIGVENETITETIAQAKPREAIIASALVALEPFPTLKDFLFSKETELSSLFKTLRGQISRNTGHKKASLSPSLSSHASPRITTEKGDFSWTGSPKARSPISSPKGSGPRGLSGHHSHQSPVPKSAPFSPKQVIKVSLVRSPKQDLHRLGKKQEFPMPNKEKVVYIYGGHTEASMTVDIYHPKTGAWSQNGCLRAKRADFGSLVVGNKVIILGGKEAESPTCECESISASLQLSEKVELRLPAARSNFACLRCGEEIYIAGGNEGNIVAKCEVYRQKAWKSLANMRENRENLALCAVGKGQIMAIGGNGVMDTLRSCEIYINSDWLPGPSLKQPRQGHSAVSTSKGIIAIGGFDGHNYLSSFEIYEIETREWSIRGEIRTPRAFFSLCLSEDSASLWLFGGFNGSALAAVERMHIETGLWEEESQLPAPRYGHGCALLALL